MTPNSSYLDNNDTKEFLNLIKPVMEIVMFWFTGWMGSVMGSITHKLSSFLKVQVVTLSICQRPISVLWKANTFYKSFLLPLLSSLRRSHMLIIVAPEFVISLKSWSVLTWFLRARLRLIRMFQTGSWACRVDKPIWISYCLSTPHLNTLFLHINHVMAHLLNFCEYMFQDHQVSSNLISNFRICRLPLALNNRP